MVVSGKKQKHYLLLLVWATQSMFRIVANKEFRAAGGVQPPCPGLVGCVGWGLATWRWPRVPLPPTISFNHCRRHGALAVVCAPGGGNAARGIVAAPLNQSWQLWVLFPCHSVYLEFALHTLWVYALFICSSRSRGWKRKEGGPVFALCRSLTWEELGWWRDAELIFIHSDAIFHHHSIRSLGPTAINNSADMFLIHRAATRAALWILEEKMVL